MKLNTFALAAISLSIVFVSACVPPAPPATTWYADSDADGYGDPAVSTTGNTKPEGYVANQSDCDDSSAAINPGATEIYDGADNNCNGIVDEGFVAISWYLDSDADGFGDSASTTESLEQPPGYVLDNTDCDDANPAINPAASEVYDSVDNNCDGQVDEGFDPVPWYPDSDGDSYGENANSVLEVVAPSGYVADNSDCDDNNASINPGALELYDGIDNNCDGEVDEGFIEVVFYRDADGDGYGDLNDSTVNIAAPDGFVENSDDCDDSSAAISPVAEEVIDGVDNNCDGNVDELDTDADGTWDIYDNCPLVANADQADVDGDGIGNACDNCPSADNSDQLDTDGDSEGDACDSTPLGEQSAGIYVIINEWVLDKDCVTDDGGDLKANQCDGSDSQRWEMFYYNDAWFFKNVGNGRCINNNGFDVVTASCNYGNAQMWTLDYGRGIDKIRVKNIGQNFCWYAILGGDISGSLGNCGTTTEINYSFHLNGDMGTDYDPAAQLP